MLHFVDRFGPAIISVFRVLRSLEVRGNNLIARLLNYLPCTDTDVCNGLFVTGFALYIVGHLPLLGFRVLMPADLRQFSTVVSALSSG